MIGVLGSTDADSVGRLTVGAGVEGLLVGGSTKIDGASEANSVGATEVFKVGDAVTGALLGLTVGLLVTGALLGSLVGLSVGRSVI